MQSLPQNIDNDTYWRDIYKQPLPFWQQALTQIAMVHDLDADTWTRATLGRNIVFYTPELVVKLGPPCWSGEMAREIAALGFVAGRLPVATPVLVASGTLDGWEYLVQERLPGTNLWELWSKLDSDNRATLAYQHGQLMAALHALPLDDAPTALHFDWAKMLGEHHALCAADMRTAGVDAALVDQVEPYLAATPWGIDGTSPVLLHGDLTHLNFLVNECNGAWQITGLVDWGDARIGPRTHEYISPGVHMYKGDPGPLSQWYEGYGLELGVQAAGYQHLIMSRAMLYYPDDMLHHIQTIQDAAACTDWSTMASAFWKMDGQQGQYYL
jgi:hygromycin-B 7''-O-kinase